MGTWGAGIYENDDAADWSFEIVHSGLAAVEAALDTAIDAEYIDAPDGACALAAADILARLVSGRGDDSAYSEDVSAWVAENAAPPEPALVAKAMAATGRIRGESSELRELWSEDVDSLAEWLATVADIEERLSA